MRLAAYGEPVEGTPFGRYRLIELLGRGGMGEVFRAYDTDTDRIVAIKLLPAHFSDNEEFKQRFRREAHAAAGLNTPHVVPIHHYGEIDGRLYVDMRLIEGRDLESVLADGPLQPARAVRIIEGVALALQAAHEVGLLHRDVKPSNILLDRHDFAYLIDFGIARAADETRLTKSGNAIGTFQYIAPERLGSRTEEDARADIYSLACVLYECLTGHPPFDEDSMAGLVVAHLNTPPPQPSTTEPNVPAQIDPVIATGMAKDPDQRYATTVELANAARDAITVPIPRPIPPTEPDDRRNIEHRADTLVENRGSPLPAKTVLDYPDTPSPQQIPALASDPPLMATPHGSGGDVAPPVGVSPDAATQLRSPSGAPLPLPPGPGMHPGVARPPAQPPRPRQLWRRKRVVIPVAVVLAVAVAAVVIVAIVFPNRRPAHSFQTAPGYGSQMVLPFSGLSEPQSVAVDAAGTLYVADSKNIRVVKLAAGATTQVVMSISGLTWPYGVAVDPADTLYVVDNSGPVFKLAAGATSPTKLPLSPQWASGVAVDSAGDVYVSDRGSSGVANGKVVKLAPGATTQVELPFSGLTFPQGVAVDGVGNVYVSDYENNRVVKLAAGATTQVVLPFSGINSPWGVAVDGAGNLYVTEYYNNRVLKMPVGSNTPIELPFNGLNQPQGVAVDAAGNVYVSDTGNNRVLKLPVH